MQNKKFDVNKLRVASPCPVGWDSMNGDNRMRVCDQCDRRVYNIAAMSVSEVETLVSPQRGRICVQLFRREDGTVLTQDCPVGLRMMKRRLGRVVAAAFGSLLGLISVGYGQNSEKPKQEQPRTERAEEKGKSILKGVVVDANGAVIPSVRIELFQEGVKKPRNLRTDENGLFEFSSLLPGKFRIRAKMKYWKTAVLEGIVLNDHDLKIVTILMEPKSITVTVGMLEE